MYVGIFANSHGHLDNIRLAVKYFNELRGLSHIRGRLGFDDRCSTATRVACPLVGCFGDNESNIGGLMASLSFVSTTFGEPPVFYCGMTVPGSW